MQIDTLSIQNIVHADPCGQNIEKNLWSINKDGILTQSYTFSVLDYILRYLILGPFSQDYTVHEFRSSKTNMVHSNNQIVLKERCCQWLHNEARSRTIPYKW